MNRSAEPAQRRAAPRARRGAAVIAIACLLAAATVAAQRPAPPRADDTAVPPDLGWLDRRAVDAGEVAIYAERGERAVTVAKVAILIRSSAEAIWNVLIGCALAPDYVPNVVSCRSLEVLDDGRAELFVQVVKPAFFLPTFEHVFRLDYYPYRHIDVHRVSGPIERMEGAWWLLPQPDGAILLVYEIELDPGMPVPRLFVRGTLKRDLPRVVQAVRERAEAKR